MKVFVYGSLLSGLHNHCVLGDSPLVGAGQTVDGFTLYDYGSFPAASRQAGARVQGEVYECDQRAMRALDRLEGYPRFYTRTFEDVELADGSTVSAWMYFIADERLLRNKRRVEGGCWRTHQAATA